MPKGNAYSSICLHCYSDLQTVLGLPLVCANRAMPNVVILRLHVKRLFKSTMLAPLMAPCTLKICEKGSLIKNHVFFMQRLTATGLPQKWAIGESQKFKSTIFFHRAIIIFLMKTGEKMLIRTPPYVESVGYISTGSH